MRDWSHVPLLAAPALSPTYIFTAANCMHRHFESEPFQRYQSQGAAVISARETLLTALRIAKFGIKRMVEMLLIIVQLITHRQHDVDVAAFEPLAGARDTA